MRFYFFFILTVVYANSLFAYNSLTVLGRETGIVILKSPAIFRGNITAGEAYNAFMHDKFKPLPEQARSLGFDNMTIWVGFIALNVDGERLYLNLKNPSLDKLECFAYQNGKLVSSSKGGAFTPIAQRVDKRLDSRFRLQRESVPTIYLIKINSKCPLLFALQIGTSGALKSAEIPNIIVYSLFVGCFASLFLYNLILYMVTKEKGYLLYSIYIFCFFILITAAREYFLLILPSDISFQNIIKLISLPATFTMFIFFMLNFLEIKKLSKNLHQTSIIIAWLGIALYMSMLIGFSGSILGTFLMLIETLFCMFVTIFALYHGYKLAQMYLVALIGFFISLIVFILTIDGLLPYNAFTQSSLLFGSAWEIVFFSLALGHKIKHFYDERNKAMFQNEAQNKMLFLQSRYASMGETVGNIAHQWKQPLNAISTIQTGIKAALIFQGGISKEKLLHSVETSFKLLQHLAETIDTFYSFLTQQNSKSTSFMMAEIFAIVQKITEYSFKNSNIKLCCKSHCNPIIHGDANEFTHAILNLILNAKEALEESHPDTPTITIQVTQEEKNCTVIVSDNAGGITIDPIHTIFDWHISSKENGSGVGLYMTKNIIEKRLDGSITVENKDDGACFIIKLPCLITEKQETSINYDVCRSFA